MENIGNSEQFCLAHVAVRGRLDCGGARGADWQAGRHAGRRVSGGAARTSGLITNSLLLLFYITALRPKLYCTITHAKAEKKSKTKKLERREGKPDIISKSSLRYPGRKCPLITLIDLLQV
ncbi:hypothetical protein E2C01_077957 [Portunus trituberculatus]|uniref:Uncharacterized protein n=1 Tax=Portunus trituberculatus TaxID=210409 RepID=A0A5B7IHB0_PORTR|nr:hypothetical protein [Portunus trituberculatus]